jgi:hypothetical protein
MDTSSPEFLLLKFVGIIISILLAGSAARYYAKHGKELKDQPKGKKVDVAFRRFIYGQPLIFGGILLIIVVAVAIAAFRIMNS